MRNQSFVMAISWERHGKQNSVLCENLARSNIAQDVWVDSNSDTSHYGPLRFVLCEPRKAEALE